MGSLIKKVNIDKARQQEKTERRRDNRSILIKRIYGGIGDILMTRPLMREVKRLNSTVILHYSVPNAFIPLLVDLDDIDEIIPIETLANNDEEDYGWSGDISTACIKHETMFRSRVHEQRMDIWARHVGIELTQHHANLRFTNVECINALEAIEAIGYRSQKYMTILPVSADKSRRLPDTLIRAACSWSEEHEIQPIILTEHPWDGPDMAPNLFGLELRIWMAAICHASMFFGTDTGGLHVAGFAGVPGAAAFCHTSGSVVCKHYSSIVPVQLHRDDPCGMACCPCYDWGSCPWVKASGLPLKCFADLPSERVANALDKAFNKEPVTRRHSIIERLDWSKVRREKSSIIRADMPPQDKRISITMICKENRPALGAIAGTIASIARSMHRNTVFSVRTDGPAAELLHGHRYATLVKAGAESPPPGEVDESETHVLDGLLGTTKPLVKSIMDKFGIDIREASPCFYIDFPSMSAFTSVKGNKCDFWFVSCKRKVVCSDYQRIDDDASWNWRTRVYAMSRSIAVITDDIDVAIVAACSHYALIYLGDRQYVLEKLPHLYICCDEVPCITKDTLKTTHV